MGEYEVLEVKVGRKTLKQAKEAALEELGLPAERVDFTIIQEEKAGFLGIGGQDAVIVAKEKPRQKSRQRRGRRSRNRGGSDATSQSGSDSNQGARTKNTRGDTKGRGQGPSGSRGAPKSENSSASKNDRNQSNRKNERSDGKNERSDGKNERSDGKNERSDRPERGDIEEQATVAKEFLEGLLVAFGLEGEVTTEINNEILTVRVDGDQTEALVGQRGTIMQAVLELTRTVIQRKTFGVTRMRIDIAGYGERRRQALTIYAGKLAEKVLAESGEVMLEAMNPADRKAVHDAIAEIEGVRSFSEGEEPDRAVVIAVTE